MNRGDCTRWLTEAERHFRAALASATYFHRACLKDPTLADAVSLRVRDIRDCMDGIEDTYLVRTFALFESAVRDYWRNGRRRQSCPDAKPLMDALAVHLRAPFAVLANAHLVREYRNGVVHGGTVPSKISITDAVIRLSLFLSHLPKQW